VKLTVWFDESLVICSKLLVKQLYLSPESGSRITSGGTAARSFDGAIGSAEEVVLGVVDVVGSTV